MKKNRIMRIASFVLVLTLLSTCAISGTFAKYVTTDSDSDNAQVAKWGVTIAVAVDETDDNPAGAANAFTTTYAKDDNTYGDTNTVVANGSYDLLAPGTKGTLATIAINGTPEVAVRMDYVVDIELTGWTLEDDSVYFPVVFKIGDTPIDTTALDDIADIEEAIEDAIVAAIDNGTATKDSDTKYTEDVAANVSLAKNVTVTWAWAFEGENANDTYLGNQAATATASTIAFDIAITATQID